MKNTLKIVLVIIGAGFLIIGLYSLFWLQETEPGDRRQHYGMLGVGLLFLLGGLSMGSR